jgi:hypothetical protein
MTGRWVLLGQLGKILAQKGTLISDRLSSRPLASQKADEGEIPSELSLMVTSLLDSLLSMDALAIDRDIPR